MSGGGGIVSRPVYIYGLFDPRDGRLRYIGKTVTSLKKRLEQHLSPKQAGDGTRRGNWISLLLKQNLRPDMRLLTQTTEADWERDEKDWIARARADGCALVNATDGGRSLCWAANGRIRVWTDEQRAAVSARFKRWNAEHPDEAARVRRPKGWDPTPEARERMRQAQLTRERMPEETARRKRGKQAWLDAHPEWRIKSDETRAKIAAANKGKVYSADTRARISATLTGRTQDPAIVEKRAQAMRGRKHDPERRERQAEAMRQSWARRKAAGAMQESMIDVSARMTMEAPVASRGITF